MKVWILYHLSKIECGFFKNDITLGGSPKIVEIIKYNLKKTSIGDALNVHNGYYSNECIVQSRIT